MNHTTQLFDRVRQEIGKVIVGNDESVDLLLTALLCQGHILLEGPPGTAKTLLVRTLSRVLSLDFQRVQFTPDLMPADVLGTLVLDLESQTFHLRRGPVFTQLLLADEINRAPAKTQSALLQAMMEAEVTIDRESYPLGDFFLVVATQNPVEMEGTYPLPEAQLDRFLFQIEVGYPEAEAETEILQRHHMQMRQRRLDEFGLERVATMEDLLQARNEVMAVQVRSEVAEYVTRLMRATREHPWITLGASPRAGLMTLIAAKGLAARSSRDYVTPDDIKGVLPSTLRHRLHLHPSAAIEGQSVDAVVDEILTQTEVPR